LIVDDEPDFVRGLARSIPREIPARILSAFDAFEALRLIDAHSVDLVVSDIRMPDMDGIELLQEIKSRDPLITVVVMTAYGTIGEAVDAMKKGAYDFVQKLSSRMKSIGFLRKPSNATSRFAKRSPEGTALRRSSV
jgi:DNA-binding NtrC family response regulator